MLQGIVLIDLHQLNVKTTLDNANLAAWIPGQPHVNEEQNRRTTTRNIMPSKWLNKLASLLSKKGPKFLSLGHWKAAVRDNVKETYTSIKSDEEWTSRVLPSEQDDIVNSLNYRGIAMVDLQFTTFLTVTDCVLALSQTK